ncbi:type I methionyl aminopeptidase [Desulfosporosinus nitroreducens]|uniref:Methionine aminopeptidase n=1 Tax=Desulfosporosinus nitroreducens TaxID=2018668 RepID=A0ABT8QYR7_9FIRM|nr:type I methionyl aminopeptidase [Desulfosporosinus nitroreducens]MCO1604253.1 type I methionyl aminopeptidase [Desulfosporosinus nitroreducens]MDO0825780.1 type I methionyl aminopeptidase [Desulfosporosinus nitroreducens]
MVIIKTAKEIGYMEEAGKILTACHREIRDLIRPGITTLEIDQFAEEFIRSHGATPEQKGYKGYPFATCASVNDEICHGFPTKDSLKDGDIVKIDMVVNLQGWLADSAWTYPVGQISKEAERLIKVTKECLYLGIEASIIGNRIGDISHAIQSHAEGQGFSVVRDFMGHGIGQIMHEDLQVPHYGRPHRGERLREGMVFTIEPMINIGSYHLKIDPNKWTARTTDGSLSAQYEHTIAITKNSPLVLTEQRTRKV